MGSVRENIDHAESEIALFQEYMKKKLTISLRFTLQITQFVGI